MKKNSKKITSNRKRFRKKSYYKGGRKGPPKGKMYGYPSEGDYERDRDRERDRERLERQIQKVLTDPVIETITIVIMRPDQAEIFQTYIRENIRVEDNIQNYNQMISNFINEAFRLLDDEQRSLLIRIMNAIQQERQERIRNNQSLRRSEILDIIERVVQENMDEMSRGGSTFYSKKKYYKRYTAKNKSNRRK